MKRFKVEKQDLQILYVTLHRPPYENENILYKTKWNEKDVTITEIKMKFEGEE